MFKVNLVQTPLCDYKIRNEAAVYNFTDAIKIESKTKTISIGYSCEKHLDKINKKLRG